MAARKSGQGEKQPYRTIRKNEKDRGGCSVTREQAPETSTLVAPVPGSPDPVDRAPAAGVPAWKSSGRGPHRHHSTDDGARVRSIRLLLVVVVVHVIHVVHVVHVGHAHVYHDPHPCSLMGHGRATGFRADSRNCR